MRTRSVQDYRPAKWGQPPPYHLVLEKFEQQVQVLQWAQVWRCAWQLEAQLWRQEWWSRQQVVSLLKEGERLLY